MSMEDLSSFDLEFVKAQCVTLISHVVNATEGWVWIRGGTKEENSPGHISSLFVLEATVFNMTTVFLILFLWIMNRQLHLRPTKGSTVVRTAAADDDKDSSTSSDTDDESSDHGDDFDDENDDYADDEDDDDNDDDDDVDTKDVNNNLETLNVAKQARIKQRREQRRKRRQRQRQQSQRKPPKDLRRLSQSMQALLTSVTEDDDDEEEEFMDDDVTTDDEIYDDEDENGISSTRSMAAIPTSRRTSSVGVSSNVTLEDKRNLLRVLKKIKVFSYLNEEAQAICLDYLEYVDVSKGKYVCSNTNGQYYDGSLYAVVDGSVECLFHDYVLPMDDETIMEEEVEEIIMDDDDGCSSKKNNNNKNILTFSSRPGDIVTPLLAILGGLVKDHNNNNTKNNAGNRADHLTSFTNGVSIVGKAAHTRLIRVPPKCFSVILQKYPLEVNRIIHTVVCRVQRVSVQILARTLGLRTELYGHTNYRYRDSVATRSINNNNDGFKPTSQQQEQEQKRQQERQQKKQLLSHIADVLSGKTTVETTTSDNGNNGNNEDGSNTTKEAEKHQEEESKKNDPQEQGMGEDEKLFESIKVQAILLAATEMGVPTTLSDESNANSSSIPSPMDLLSKHSSITSLPKGQYLAQTGIHNDAVYLLLQGEVELGVASPPTTVPSTANMTMEKNNMNNQATQQQQPSPPDKKRLAVLRPGVLLGSLAAFSGEVSLFTLRCLGNNSEKKTDNDDGGNKKSRNTNNNNCVFLKIPRSTFLKLTETYPDAVIKCLERFLKLLSPIVHLLNWNSDWLQVKAAELIVHQYDPCDSMYLVLNGRIRAHYRGGGKGSSSMGGGGLSRDAAVSYASSRGSSTQLANSDFGGGNKMDKHNHKKRFFEEFGRGRCVGNIEGLTGNPWPYDIYAIRNSELVRVPMKTLLTILGMYPRSGLHLARNIAARIQQQQQQRQQVVSGGAGISSGPTVVINNNNKSANNNNSNNNKTRQLPSSSPVPQFLGSSSLLLNSPSVMPSYGLNLATIAVVSLCSPSSLSAADSLSNFCITLASTCNETIAPTKLMTKSVARQNLLASDRGVSRSRNKPMHDLKMTRLLGDIEENYRLIIYQADLKYTWWTKLCISQADLILVLVNTDTEFETTTTATKKSGTNSTRYDNIKSIYNNRIHGKSNNGKDDEKYREQTTTTTTKTTPENTKASSSSSSRNQIEQCLAWAYDSMHVRIEMVVLSNSSSSNSNRSRDRGIASSYREKESTRGNENTDNIISNEDDDHYYGYYDNETNFSDQLHNWFEQREWLLAQHIVREPFMNHKLDFCRLCRRVTGKSIGLVLGGGGARGLAHLGIIKALMEAGITVDMVGGTSQGAFIGALYAKHPDNYKQLKEASYKMSVAIGSAKEMLMDLTLPITSLFSGVRFNYNIRKQFKKLRIQDLILRFFCMSTDLQKRTQVVHTKGLLWKYVRASMSLTGYLPPVAENGSLLVDGGYTNLVPADIMRYHMGAKTVIAVDVSPEDSAGYHNYGTGLSGWWILWNSINPFVRTVQVPSMTDLSDSLRWVSSDQHRKNIVQATDLHLIPPVGKYGTLEYGYFDEIIDIGYEYAKPIIDDWIKQNPHLVQ